MRTVIFDLDGTLADTGRDLIDAANAEFRRLGHGDVLDPEADKATAFRGGRAMLRLGIERLGLSALDADAEERSYLAFLDAYEGCLDRHTALYPGTEPAVRALAEAGYALGVCTNKPEAMAEKVLAALGLRDAFGSLIGADTLPVRKPDPAPYRAAVERAGGVVAASVLIGDTVTDRDTARAAGVPVVLVGFGPEGAAVSALEPDAVLDDYGDLAGVVRRLIG